MGGIPNPLNIKDCPELNKFPATVLFMDAITENRRNYVRWAPYNPLLNTYKKRGQTMTMTYQNKYQNNWHLKITYRADKNRYEGRKYQDGKLIIYALGTTWRAFFYNLTRRGVEDGEE